jgi:FkbM family methyltransferase
MAEIVRSAGYFWTTEGTVASSDDYLGPGDHEASLEPLVRELLGTGAFLDVGAHVGHYAIRLAAQSAAVIAVEPNPEIAWVLRRNVALNLLEDKVTVLEVAAWDSRETLRLADDPRFLFKNRCAMTRTVPEDAVDDTSRPPVQGVPLDELLADVTGLTLVKVDVEGADLQALRGMAGTLRRERSNLLVERHDVLGHYTIEQLYELLQELGYSWTHVEDDQGGSKYLACHPEVIA